VLDGAPCPDARARHAPGGGPGQLALGSRFWAAPASKGRARRAPPVAALGWRGASNSCLPARLGAQRPAGSPYKQSVTEGGLWRGSAPPNGSRLSCSALVKDSNTPTCAVCFKRLLDGKLTDGLHVGYPISPAQRPLLERFGECRTDPISPSLPTHASHPEPP